MLTHILGKKVGMTQLFGEGGEVIPVTIVEAGPCRVVQVKTPDVDGYSAAQIGYGRRKASRDGARRGRLTKPLIGHFAKAGLAEEPPQLLREVPCAPNAVKVGDTVSVGIFEGVSHVDVVGTSKGRGFTGTVKRHGFTQGPRSHGSMNVRAPGSIGQHQDPGRVFKGKKLPGHFGAERTTVRHLKVVKCDPERNLLFVRGAVPGSRGGFILIRKTNWVN